MSDIYKYRERLGRFRRRIADLKNGDLALGFLDHLEALGLSAGRVLKYAIYLSTLLKVMDFDLHGVSRRDVERVVAWVNSQPYRAWTKHDFKLTLRKLVQYAKYGRCDKNTPLPPEVAWIPLRVKEDDPRVKPENILTADGIKALVSKAENERDRALLYALFEGALRPGELLTMTVGGVEFRDGCCLASVHGKTGIKRIPLVLSFKPLLEWLKKHPERDNPEAPLWISLSNSAKGLSMSYDYLRNLLKRLAKRAGIGKDVWPYLFRHSCLTSLAKVFTESRLQLYAGWVQGSKMARRYVHFSARDLEDAVLQLHGLKKPEETNIMLRLTECPRCGEKNQPDNVRCGFCGFTLDREKALRMAEEDEAREREIMERLERLERVVSSLLKSQQGNVDPEQDASAQQSPGGSPLKPPYQPQYSRPNRTTTKQGPQSLLKPSNRKA